MLEENILKEENKNFLYNVIYQVFIFVVPLITMPYISRILGVENIGIYSYTYSIVYYFMLASLLGINNYGSRRIAKVSNDKEKMSRTFFSIYYLQLILTIIFSILYLLIFVCFVSKYKGIFIIQYIFLLSVAFDINWFFFGIEKFKITISRNVIIKLLSMLLIFVFVKNENQLSTYTLIMSFSTLISQVYLWFYVFKYVKFVRVSIKEILNNLKPCLILFVPVIAYSIYNVMDKTMIGAMANTLELGYYESAEKITNIPISFITALGTVMIPHMSKMKEKDVKNKIMESFELAFLFIVPMCFGLLGVSNNFSLIFFGEKFTRTGTIIKLLIPSILITTITNIIRTNFLIPMEKDKIYIVSTTIGAIANLIFNLVFIPRLGEYGAAIGTVISQIIVMMYQLEKVKDEINLKNIFKLLMKYVKKGIIIFILILILNFIIKNNILRLVIQIALAVIIYFIMNYNYIWYDFFGKNKKKII